MHGSANILYLVLTMLFERNTLKPSLGQFQDKIKPTNTYKDWYWEMDFVFGKVLFYKDDCNVSMTCYQTCKDCI